MSRDTISFINNDNLEKGTVLNINKKKIIKQNLKKKIKKFVTIIKKKIKKKILNNN